MDHLSSRSIYVCVCVKRTDDQRLAWYACRSGLGNSKGPTAKESERQMTDEEADKIIALLL